MGGMGTTYDANHTDKVYARIDGGPSNPGYFTIIQEMSSDPYDFIENGIYYKYTGYNGVEVVNDGTDEYFCYSGNVEIPETAYDADDGWYYRVASIGERAFYRCPSLVTVTIPATVDLIHNEAFVDCFDEYPSQSSITCLAQTPPTASPTAFDSYIQSTVPLYVPYGKKSAYQAAAVWRNFSNIVELNYSFKKDGFYYKITGSNTVSVTYKDANYNTYSGRVLIPRRVTFEDVTYTVTAIDNLAFFGCTGLTSVTIPETVTTIGNRTFKNCTSLTSITIPNSVTSIGVYAFENCEGLTEVTLGSGLQSIGAYAFYGCTELMRGNIISLATVPPTIQNSTFVDQYQGASLYVPFGCRDAYANANYWQNFYDIYEIITLDDALNVDGGNIEFTSGGDYPWVGAASDGRAYAVSGNRGVANSTSTLTAVVNVEKNSILSFDFKSWGEGTDRIYDMCIFLIDGVEQFCDGARDNDWETFNVELAPGAHMLEWRYSKDDSVDPTGDYFAVDNVQIVTYEAYACYTESNTTLTFYYDSQRSSRTGTTYDLNTGYNDTDWDTDGTKDYVTKVVFDPSFANARPTTTYSWFYGMGNLQSITGMSYLNTSEVTDMLWMFHGCSSLTSLDLSSFNTSQVTNMAAMFNKCTNLRTIYVGSNWSTAAVTSSPNMFKNCTSLVGGQGTTYNPDYIDKTYAHIDGGPSNPGYFTDKNAIKRGDINGDGIVDVSDVTMLISAVLGNQTVDSAVADMNGDNVVDVSDVTALISLVLSI
jgi:surface protein